MLVISLSVMPSIVSYLKCKLNFLFKKFPCSIKLLWLPRGIPFICIEDAHDQVIKMAATIFNVGMFLTFTYSI